MTGAGAAERFSSRPASHRLLQSTARLLAESGLPEGRTLHDIHVYHAHGQLEKVCENALAHRLAKAGLVVEQQHPITIHDELGNWTGQAVGMPVSRIKELVTGAWPGFEKPGVYLVGGEAGAGSPGVSRFRGYGASFVLQQG